MRNLLFKSLPVICAFAVTLAAADTFEGQYDMAFSDKGEAMEVSFWVKGGHLRMKVADAGQMGEMILRDGMSTMIMVMPQQRMYMEMPFPMDSFTPDNPDVEDGDFPFEKTGNAKKILGFKAQEFLFEHNGEKMVIWATDELGSMPFARNPMLQGWAEAMSRLTGLKSFFPLEVTGTQKGRDAYRMTVTKVEKKSLPDSMFLPPEGFMKMTMPAGMGGFMPGG